MITVKMINTIGADLKNKNNPTTTTTSVAPATFVPVVATGAAIAPQKVDITEEEKTSLEIERKKLDKDKEIQQIDSELIQKKFDNLKDDYNKSQDDLAQCTNENERNQIILLKVRQFCSKVETDESAELCTLLYK
jgi:hypothetical protein